MTLIQKIVIFTQYWWEALIQPIAANIATDSATVAWPRLLYVDLFVRRPLFDLGLTLVWPCCTVFRRHRRRRRRRLLKLRARRIYRRCSRRSQAKISRLTPTSWETFSTRSSWKVLSSSYSHLLGCRSLSTHYTTCYYSSRDICSCTRTSCRRFEYSLTTVRITTIITRVVNPESSGTLF